MLMKVIVRLVLSLFYPEDRMNRNYGTNNYNEACKEIVIFNKDYNGLPHNIKPYVNHRPFDSSYRRYVFDAKYQNGHIGSRQIQLNFYFSYAVVDVICHALVLSRKVISVKSVPINDNSIIVQKGLNKKNNIDFSYYEKKTFYGFETLVVLKKN